MGIRIYKKAFVIADDFTGANDTVAQFSKVGYRCVVIAEATSCLREMIQRYDVVGINTNSRSLHPSEAYEKVLKMVKEIVSVLSGLGYQLDEVLIYKKIDSTLRGNIREEIKAIYEEINPDLIVFAPAYPKQKRITIKGVHLLNNIPVDKTYFGRDIQTPVRSSYIPSYFSRDFGDKYRHIDLDELRSLQSFDVCSYRLISSDIENDQDLSKLIAIVNKCEGARRVIWIGSAGLAEHLIYFAMISPSHRKPVFMCIGSANDVMRKQIIKLINTGGNHIFIALDIERLIKNFNDEYRDVIGKIMENCNTKPLSIILASAFYDEQIRQGEKIAKELGIDKIALGELIMDYLGRLCSSLIKDIEMGRLSGVFLSGGDTALAIVKHLGFETLEVVGEIEPGLPLLKIANTELKFATKAGGFGDEWTLIRVLYRLIS